MSRILLIESDQVVAANLQHFLKKTGHHVDWQVDPQTAMDFIEKQAPDLLVMDLILADRSGVEFLYEFRSYPDWQKLPVVIYSSVSEGELGDASASLEQLDIAAYHYKPDTSLGELGQSIRQILEPVPA